jgi:hypothetical protein
MKYLPILSTLTFVAALSCLPNQGNAASGCNKKECESAIARSVSRVKDSIQACSTTKNCKLNINLPQCGKCSLIVRGTISVQ